MSDHGDSDIDDGGDGVHAPIWMISFADMLILMLSFFVIMALINDSKGANKGKVDPELLRVVASLKLGFGYVPDPKSLDPLDLAALQLLQQRRDRPNRFKNPLVSTSSRNQASSDEATDRLVKMKGPTGKPILFPVDKAKLGVAGKQQKNLQRIADLVRPHLREIVVHGHCSKSEAQSGEDRGFKLAYQRALYVQQQLSKLGVRPDRIRLVSCGYHAPYKQRRLPPKGNDADKREPIDPERLNRRAEVTLGTYYLPGRGTESAE